MDGELKFAVIDDRPAGRPTSNERKPFLIIFSRTKFAFRGKKKFHAVVGADRELNVNGGIFQDRFFAVDSIEPLGEGHDRVEKRLEETRRREMMGENFLLA